MANDRDMKLKELAERMVTICVGHDPSYTHEQKLILREDIADLLAKERKARQDTINHEIAKAICMLEKLQ